MGASCARRAESVRSGDPGRQLECRILGQDPFLQSLQRWARLDPELLDERLPVPAGTPRAPLPAGRRGRGQASAGRAAAPAEGVHRPAPAARRARPRDARARGRSRFVPSARSAAARRAAPPGHARETRAGARREWGRARASSASRRSSAAASSSPADARSRAAARRCCRCATSSSLGIDLDAVAAVHGRDRVAAVPCQRLPQPRDVAVDGLPRRRRRRLAPEFVDQPFARDELVRMQEQDRQDEPLLQPAQRDRLALVDHLQWPEDPVLHQRVLPLPKPERKQPEAVRLSECGRPLTWAGDSRGHGSLAHGRAGQAATSPTEEEGDMSKTVATRRSQPCSGWWPWPP